jgi:hypothetical protein
MEVPVPVLVGSGFFTQKNVKTWSNPSFFLLVFTQSRSRRDALPAHRMIERAVRLALADSGAPIERLLAAVDAIARTCQYT